MTASAPTMKTSLDRVLGNAPTPPEDLRRMARRAWLERGIPVFLPDDLERMPAMARALVEAEMARIHGAREGRHG